MCKIASDNSGATVSVSGWMIQRSFATGKSVKMETKLGGERNELAKPRSELDGDILRRKLVEKRR
jgi:hypothetical protein